MSVNKAILVGRLGADPETRYTSGGAAVTNFNLATDETFKDRSGEKQKKTEWHRIVLFSRLAEIAQEYLKKGSLVFIEGRLQTRQWEDKKGVKKSSTEIVGTTLRMLSYSGPSQPKDQEAESSSGSENGAELGSENGAELGSENGAELGSADTF